MGDQSVDSYSRKPEGVIKFSYSSSLVNRPAEMLQAGGKVWPPLAVTKSRPSFYARWGKRLLDITFAMVGLSISFPLVVVAAVAIRLDSQGPVFFRQRRVGKYGRSFEIVKLRTMADLPGSAGPMLTVAGDPRITRVGKWLRKTKIDEIPQLLNVLKGEMSLVGPRPKVPELAITNSSSEEKVFDFTPGLTGPATVAFIDEESVLACHPNEKDFYVRVVNPVKLDLDIGYCERVTLLGDVKLMALTLVRLFYRPRIIVSGIVFNQPFKQ